MVKWILLTIGVLVVVALLGLYAVGRGVLGEHEGPGEVTEVARDREAVVRSAAALDRAAGDIGAPRAKQILFGDLHVHTTFSFDAFLISLPVQSGEGAHPPADACDFARFCSALDFWSINDHAEGITPLNWRETVESIRQCNDVAGGAEDPDTVAFLGWEWTQVGAVPDEHFGHKNVVLAHTEDERIPARPIASGSTTRLTRRAARANPIGAGALFLASGEQRFHDLAKFLDERAQLDLCPEDVGVRDMPADCIETAETPADLFRKLDDWGHDAIVIPHGTTWGFYTPPGSSWDKQLAGDMHDPDRQTLFEIYSGHGDSEVFRSWRELELAEDGSATCPEPTADYLPTCWRAGEIIRERCLAEGAGDDECEARAVEARANAAAAGQQAHLTVPGAQAAEWLDAGQCTDCSTPAFNYRPRGSAQYVMALSNFDEPGAPRRFRFGFMSSSDNHFARPGTGFKEVHRHGFTESRERLTRDDGGLASVLSAPEVEPQPRSVPFDRESSQLAGFALFELERQASFFLTGGLIATHSEGRDRESIWDAMQRREVYGTSGPRMLLWFDLLNPPGTGKGSLPMGSAVEMERAPIFQVRAVGSFEQKPGCPDYAEAALGPERLEHVCKGECYHPSDTRRQITRIEVVRIRPQERVGEPVAELVADPWQTFACDPDPQGCVVTFSDPDYERDGRDTLYYVRAVEAPTPTINADNVRCERDAEGNCLEANLCGTDASDECLGEYEPKAWSSPIFVDRPRGT